MKTIFRILVIFLLLTSSCLAYELGDKFNKDDFTKYLDMGDERIAYTLKNDTLNFYGIEANSIIYVFYKDKLYAKYFTFSIYEPTVILENILTVLKDHYGEPITKRSNPINCYYLTNTSSAIFNFNNKYMLYEFTICDNALMMEFHAELKK